MKPAVPFLAIALAGALLSGCAAPLPPGLPRGTFPAVRLTLLAELGGQLGEKRVFFAEYLEDVGPTTRRVAVLAEPVEGPLRLVFNPRRYAAGVVGAAELGELAARFAPLQLHLVQDNNGRTLGYALFPRGRSLHLVDLRQDRYALDFEGN